MNTQAPKGPSNRSTLDEMRALAPSSFGAWLDQTFQKLPEKEAADWNKRLKKASPDFEATLLEVMALDLALKQGLTLEAVHPDFGSRAKGNKPDFHLRLGTIDVVVEAKYVSLQDEKTSERWKRAGQLVRGLDKHLGDLGRSFNLTVFKQPAGSLKYAKIAHEIKEAIRANPNEKEYGFLDAQVGLRFQITATGPSRNGLKSILSFGLGNERGMFSELHLGERMQTALENKLKKYGRLHVPLVLVLGTDEVFAADHAELITALFGQEQLIIDRARPDAPLGHARTLNGLLGAPGERRHTRLTGVLVLGCWSPIRLLSAFQASDGQTPNWPEPWVTWVPNPHAEQPLPQLFANFPTLEIEVDRDSFNYRLVPGATLGDALK